MLIIFFYVLLYVEISVLKKYEVLCLVICCLIWLISKNPFIYRVSLAAGRGVRRGAACASVDASRLNPYIEREEVCKART